MMDDFTPPFPRAIWKPDPETPNGLAFRLDGNAPSKYFIPLEELVATWDAPIRLMRLAVGMMDLDNASHSLSACYLQAAIDAWIAGGVQSVE